MTRTRNWQLVCLAHGDLPPLVPANLLRLPGAVWSARTLDAFLTELDAGGSLPDAVLAFGGGEIIGALRRHDRTCALPVFLFAAPEQAVPPGWDGTWTGDDLTALAAVPERAAWCAALPALAAPLDSLRREQRCARWLAARGHCQVTDLEVFGLDAPRSIFSAWQAAGWIIAPAGRNSRWEATDALRAAIGGVAPEPPAVPVADEAPAAAPPALQPAASRPAPMARAHSLSGPAPLPRSALVALSAFLIVLAALIWSGKVDLLRRGASAEAALARQRQLRIGAPPALAGSRPPGSFVPADIGAQSAAGTAVGASASGAELPAPMRTIARGTVQRVSSSLRALAAGRVTALLATPGGWIESGSPLARFVDARAEEEVARLESELQQLDVTIAASGADDTRSRELARAQSDLERERLSGELARAGERSTQAQEAYARSLKLAEEGVLSFREIRPDWEALQRAREAEEQARAALDALQAARDLPAGSGSEAVPAWLIVRRTRLADELRTARSMAAPRLLRATAEGELLSWQTALDAAVDEGSLLAQIGAAEAWIEARLAAGERSPMGKIGAVELRLGTAGSWLPAGECQELSSDAGVLLRVRVPPELQAVVRHGAAAELRFRYLD